MTSYHTANNEERREDSVNLRINSAINENDGEDGSASMSFVGNNKTNKSHTQDFNDDSSSIGDSENLIKQDNEVSYSINNLSLNVSMNLITFILFGFISYQSKWFAYYETVKFWFDKTFYRRNWRDKTVSRSACSSMRLSTELIPQI